MNHIITDIVEIMQYELTFNMGLIIMNLTE